MSTPVLNEIESQFAGLPPEAQLSLLERLVHHVRVGLAGSHDAWEADLSTMAADPEMQRELSRINAEFSAAEADGLGIFCRPACRQGSRRRARQGRKRRSPLPRLVDCAS